MSLSLPLPCRRVCICTVTDAARKEESAQRKEDEWMSQCVLLVFVITDALTTGSRSKHPNVTCTFV